MPVNLNLEPGRAVRGVSIATVASGIKADNSVDLVLFHLAPQTRAAAVFTRNAFCAAPVTLCREHMQKNEGRVRGLLINSGNANAGTGEAGLQMARGHCEALSSSLDVPVTSILPFSTGVIGQLLPDQKMHAGIALCCSNVHDPGSAAESSLGLVADKGIDAWAAAARGIMTTDTQPKLTSRTIQVDGQSVVLTGMSKGAGMIQPNMATMLAYVFTDASVSSEHLDSVLKSTVDVSFNAITVDSDTSTNDAVVLCATGQGPELSPAHEAWPEFVETLTVLCRDLAQAIIRDAEGASKFITVAVNGGRDLAECKAVAYSIANSPLVKTAMFASDANVGRLLMAIGKADIPDLDANKVSVSLGDVLAFENAGIASAYTEERGAEVMQRDEITVTVELSRGQAATEVYTSDLSHDYVSINADYRS